MSEIPGRLERWWVYQSERFPVVGHGLLIAAFSFSGLSFSHLLRQAPGLPDWRGALVGFVSCFLFFLQLRIADEHKDFEEDSRYRPYRPVPRGLVKLHELAVVFVLAGVVQLGLALLLRPVLALWLLLVWSYLALMSKEFFVRDWITKKPITYMWTHMLIMPLIDFYATACDWAPAGKPPPDALGWFLAVSFFNGLVIEIGRKLRAPEDEEKGVNTYTYLWGRPGAVGAWLGALVATTFCAALAAWQIDFFWPVGVLLGVLLAVAGTLAWRFLAVSNTSRAKWLERMSGLWTLCMYLSLGAVPVFWRWLASGAGRAVPS
jgi:4-hydroxybenzoate polyprenyltransferase